MTTPANPAEAAARERQALAAIRTLRARLDEALQARSEPIAVVGLSCRFPGGVADPADYWALMLGAVDAVRPIPPDRMDVAAIYDPRPDMPGKTYSRWAGLVDDVAAFDPDFFGVSPREAAQIDPQQRLFLEGAWLALEHAGIAPNKLVGSATGVFVGVSTSDYARLQDRDVAPEDISAYSVQGLALNAIAGRVSHSLGLHGPALAIDTACSSSLVAIDRACRSLRDEECGLALTGGVNVLSYPDGLIAGSRWGMFARDGRCKAFSAAADGFVRGEGCGVVVLKRLRDATADGDRVLAVIRGSAVNHDGPSSGLTVPNGLAQQALMRQALRAAGVDASEVSYVEAHGTGTTLGDPIEAEALGAVLGGAARRPDEPLLIGSVKTNIGHLEAAAGVAGLIKVVLALQHKVLPGQLYAEVPSPHIRWDALRLRVADATRPWRPINGRWIAGVSGFGFSGTNAHVVLEAAADATAVSQPRPQEILPLAARTEPALHALAARYLERLERGPAEDWADLCHTAAVGRAAFPRRLSVRAADAATAAVALRAFLAGTPHPALLSGHGGRPRVAFLFTGQGSQHAGMGRGLYATSPLFRAIVERAEATLADRPAAERLAVPLGAVMRGEHPEAAALLEQTLYTQPALYVLEYALAELWRGLGVEPAAVLGHSLGEYVGCAVAGVFSFEDGLRLVADRARLMHGLAADGAMLVVAASEAEVAELLRGREAEVALAGVNGPRQVTVSGARGAVEAIAQGCAARGWRTQRLPVSQAFHSPLIEPIEAALEARAGMLAYAAPRLPVISNLTGEVLPAASAAYWRAHLRQPVRFAQGLATLRGLGCDVLIELGPRPVLIQLARQEAPSDGPARHYLASLKGTGVDEWDAFCQAVQGLYAAGAELDWAGWSRGYGRRKVDAPSYPFERQRHWIAVGEGPARVPVAAPSAGAAHPLLGTRLRSALEGGQFEADLGASGAIGWLSDHRIGGQAIMPATGLMEMMLAAGAALDRRWQVLEELSIVAPLRLPATGGRTVQTVVDAPRDGTARVRVFAAAADAAGVEAPPDEQGQLAFRLHAEARLAPPGDGACAADDLAAVRARCERPIEAEAHYRALAEHGADFGPGFRGVRRLHRGMREALAEITAPLPALVADRLHPATLDACLQTAAALIGEGDETFLPTALRRFECHSAHWPEQLIAHARMVGPDPRAPEIDFTIRDTGGVVLAQLERLRFQSTANTHRPDIQEWMYQVQWIAGTPASMTDISPDGHWLLMADRLGVARALASRIRTAGGTCVVVEQGEDSPQQIVELLELAGAEEFQGVVNCWPMDLEFDASQAPADALDAQACGYASALHVIQTLAGRTPASPLYLVTSGDAPAGDMAGGPNRAMLSALRKTLLAEFPELPCRLIDLDAGQDPADAAVALAAELLLSDEPEVSLRGSRRFVPRLVALAPPTPAASEGQLIELMPAASAVIDELTFSTRSRLAPGPDEVEIEVRATGLNFRDVLNALGMLPGAAPRLGGECAGVIVRAGIDSAFAVGDPVFAFCPGQSGSFVTVPARYVAHKPERLDFAEAAGLPIAYLTALHGLHRIANLKRGETILVHAAAGGLGSAAVNLAVARGATVYATASSEAKRDYVRALGATYVTNSRTLDFADEVLAQTVGRGVDVVLNTLNGDFVPASFRALASGGRFIEVGKLGVFNQAQAYDHRPDASFHKFDLGEAAEADASLIPSLLHELSRLIETGTIPPLPVESVAYSDARSAFRKMAEARHIGKLVLLHRRRTLAPIRSTGGAYLITGGFGALGLQAAQWLATRGVQTVILGGPRRHRPESVASLEALGLTVIAAEMDCADPEALRGVLATLPPDQPLRGVIHCAGTLTDATLPAQTRRAFELAAAPKFAGALALHRATASLPLEAFVLFSSAAAVIGSAGQASYAAANAAMDAIARMRSARGEVALSVAWGPWASGMAADARVRQRTTAFEPMTAADGFAVLDSLLKAGVADACVLPLKSWEGFFQAHPSGAADPFFDAVRSARVVSGANAEAADIIARIRDLPPPGRRRVLLDYLREQVAKVLGFPSLTDIASTVPLQERGLDSLMAVEFRNALVKGLGVTLPATLALDYPTLDALCDHLLGQISPAEPPADTATGNTELTADAEPGGDAELIAALSEADAESMLLRELQNLDV